MHGGKSFGNHTKSSNCGMLPIHVIMFSKIGKLTPYRIFCLVSPPLSYHVCFTPFQHTQIEKRDKTLSNIDTVCIYGI